jgi:hypothetical protein
MTKTPSPGVEFYLRGVKPNEKMELYHDALDRYRPQGYTRLLMKKPVGPNGEYIASTDSIDRWCTEVTTFLTDWAQRKLKNDYIFFGWQPNDEEPVGFFYSVRNFEADADLRVDDRNKVPKAFSGLVAEVNDHGNLTAWKYVRGRHYELFSVV